MSFLRFSEEVRRADSQEPLRDATSSGAGASPVDMAVIWVKKAAKGSTQWTDIGTKRQLSHYKFRKRLKPLTVLIKFLYLGLAFVEVPSWCLVKDYCLEKDGIYSWKILQLPFQVSNGIDARPKRSFSTTDWLLGSNQVSHEKTCSILFMICPRDSNI